MNNYKILCEIGDGISFNIAGKSNPINPNDLNIDDNLNRIYRIQFSKPPKTLYLDKAVEIIKKRPEIALRFYGDYSEDLIDWDKLLDVQKLSIDLWHVKSLKQIGSLTNLRSLGFSKNVSSLVSLSILAPLKNLEILYTSISKDIQSIGHLEKLNSLTLREIKYDNLDFLIPLKNLKILYLSLGSFNDFNGLTHLNSLSKLDVHQVRGFNDIVAQNVLSNCKTVESLHLDNLKHLTNLNFIKQMSKLNCLSFEGIKNLDTYEPISYSKSLDTFASYQSQPADKSLSGLRKLKNIRLGDSYSKLAIAAFLKISKAENIQIRNLQLKGEPLTKWNAPVF